MSGNSKIEWTDTTWNPVRGCTRVSAGCENCYAERMAHRFSGPGKAYEGLTVLKNGGPKWTGKIRLVPELLVEPLRWRKPRRVFVNSMSDLFHPEVPIRFIADVFNIMASVRVRCRKHTAPEDHWPECFDENRHTYQILTKRPERMFKLLRVGGELERDVAEYWPGDSPISMAMETDWPLPNVWLGVSVEGQAAADERIPLLLQTPAAVRFVSVEPLLGPVDLARSMELGLCGWKGERMTPAGSMVWVGGEILDWVIVGGESGPKARPMNTNWARSIRDQCQAAGVPFFFKQHGEWHKAQPVAGGDLGGDMRRGIVRQVELDRAMDGHFRRGDVLVRRVGKKAAGRLLDGRTWDEFPRS